MRRTPANYHVEYDGFHYSVPHGLYKQLVTIRATATTIEILNDNRERVALHQRRQIGSRYITNLSHMPSNHRHQHESNQFDGAKYRMWAKNIGVQTYVAIDLLLSAQIAEEQAYRSCMGILQSSKRYGNERLEVACAKAIAMNSCSYTTIITLMEREFNFSYSAENRCAFKLLVPVDVGNSLYRYLCVGRPQINSYHVFVHHRAPYCI